MLSQVLRRRSSSSSSSCSFPRFNSFNQVLHVPRVLGFALMCSLAQIGNTNIISSGSSPTGSSSSSQTFIGPLLRRNHTPLVVNNLTTSAGQTVNTLDILQEYLNRSYNNGSEAFKPMVLCGPSGVGKSYLIRQLLKKNPDKIMSTVSHTSRSPRGSEQNGTEYHFTSREEFLKMVQAGKFVEHDEIHGNLYGTSFDAIKSVHALNKTCVMDLTIAGANQFVEACLTWQSGLGIPAPWVFYIRPESMEELEKWLRSRQTESDESLQRRLNQAQLELDELDNLDGDLFDAVITKTWVD